MPGSDSDHPTPRRLLVVISPNFTAQEQALVAKLLRTQTGDELCLVVFCWRSARAPFHATVQVLRRIYAALPLDCSTSPCAVKICYWAFPPRTICVNAEAAKAAAIRVQARRLHCSGIVYRGSSKASRLRTAIVWPSVAEHLAKETRIPIYYSISDDVKCHIPTSLLPETFKQLQMHRLIDGGSSLWQAQAAAAA